MKIAFFEIEPFEKEYLKKNLRGHNLLFFKDDINKANIKQIKDIEIISIFIYSQIDKETLDQLPNLKIITTRSTGFDHINIKETQKRKIKVLNVPHYGINTVAEHTFGLILSLSRKIHKSYERTIKGDFSLDNLRGFDLKGKTIGIVGLGNIGKHVARISKGFDMKVIAYDEYQNKSNEKEYDLKYTSFEYLLKNSDIITLHCPYNKSTHNLINNQNINSLKKSALLINTARGGIVETKALVKALLDKKIGGAGLDVLVEEEDFITKDSVKKASEYAKHNKKLLTFDNVIVTPHNAFNSIEALERILNTTIQNVNEVIKKKKLTNEV